MTKKKIILVLTSVLVWLTPAGSQQSFECGDDAWLVLAPESGNSSLLRIIRDTGATAVPTYVVLNADLGHRVDAIGFNVQDNLIYGLDVLSHSLLRIGSDGEVEDLGVPQSLDISLEYFAGAIKPEGGRMFLVGRQPDGKDIRLYTLQLQAPYNAGFVSVVSDDPINLGDIAYDPFFGSLMGFDEKGGRIIDLTSGGAVSTFPYENQPQVKSLGGLYFDASGKLLGFGGSQGQENKLHHFNRFSGVVKNTWQLQVSARSDACSCPYRLRLRKMVEPQRVIPCSEVVVTYRFENRAGISYGNVQLEDEFPPGFKITDVLHQPGFGEQVSGLGSNQLSVEGLDVLLGVDSLVIKVDVGDFSGTTASQAVLFTLPMGLGEEILSDDPATEPYPDPTILEVVADGHLLPVDTSYLCAEGQLEIAGPVGGLNYLWSNGATSQNITISQPGAYWVQTKGVCGSYRDTFQVLELPPLQLNLGEDLLLRYGTEINLNYQTNAQNPSLLWQTDSLDLNCFTCPSPQFIAKRNGKVVLRMTDSFGCQVADTLMVLVLPERFVYFPTGFSPNDDGINDYFNGMAISDFPFSDFSIFNRWGDVVFEKKKGVLNNVDDGWDGRFKGRKAAPGLYTWRITLHFSEAEQESYSGRLLLVK